VISVVYNCRASWRVICHTDRDMDAVVIGMTLVLFGLAYAFTRGCDRW
jgi:hypothetical protein